jgi:hypothetical protein
VKNVSRNVTKRHETGTNERSRDRAHARKRLSARDGGPHAGTEPLIAGTNSIQAV